MSSFLRISTRFSENQFFTIVFDIQNLICITISHRNDLLCYSRGKLCLLNMFLASADTLETVSCRFVETVPKYFPRMYQRTEI